MRSMVKLHDLVDLAEPLWRGMAKASMSGLPRDESMELDETIGNHDEEAADALASPEEANLGLGRFLLFLSSFRFLYGFCYEQ